MNEWEHPWSHEAQVIACLFDAFTQVNFTKPKPYPRPWPTEPEKQTTRRGDTAGRSRAEVISILRAHGHDI